MQGQRQLIARRSDLINVGNLQSGPCMGGVHAVKGLKGEVWNSTDLFGKGRVVPKIGSSNPKHVDVSPFVDESAIISPKKWCR
jgi:hypothetical protein